MKVERRDFIALDWVAGEIRETLGQARESLKAYIANRDDATKLRFALTYIHQVHGTLQMVEFVSAALLAEEMEQCAQALLADSIPESHVDDALAALENALEQLPGYIASVRDSRRDLPSVLLPLINDLRAVQGQGLLSETVLFHPAEPAPGETPGELILRGEELLEVARKLRQMYQIALLGVIQNRDLPKNVNYLAKVCARLVKISAGRPPQALWKVCIALMEGILNRSIEPSVAVKILLRQVDGQLRKLVNDGEAALEQAPPPELVKNLLYYVAASDARSRFIKEIKADYQLDQALIDDAVAEEGAAVGAVMEGLVAELGQAITALESAVQQDGTAREEQVADVLALLKRGTDTMAVLGLGGSLKVVQEQRTALQHRGGADPAEVTAIAERLRELVADLGHAQALPTREVKPLFNDSEEAQEELDRAFDSIVRESRTGLESAKEAIIEFVATQWRHDSLQEVPQLLDEVQGSLRLAQLERASAVIAGCRRYVLEQLLETNSVPEWQVLDTLADAITSVDYYLERLADDADTESDSILRLAEQSVSELGYGNSAEVIPFAQPAAPAEPEAPAEEAAAEPHTPAEPEPESETGENETIDIGLPAAGDTEGAAEPEQVAAAEPGEPGPVQDAAEPVAETAGADADEAVEPPDPEIVEIFIEEAGEVLETIGEHLPAWLETPRDEELLTTIRRSFHTLKGSGRMVEALDIGEMAWSVENMLNRVIDGTLELDQQRLDLVVQAKDLVPDMVRAFEQGRRFEDMARVEALMERAFALAKEQNPAAESAPAPEPPAAEDAAATQTEPAGYSGQDEEAEGAEEPDSVLLEIFAGEATTHLATLREFVAHARTLAGPAELSDDLQRALHTLKGSAHMAAVAPVAQVVTPLENLIKELRAVQHKADETVVAVLDRACDFIEAGIAQLETTPSRDLPGVLDYLATLAELHRDRVLDSERQAESERESEGVAPGALSSFLEDAIERLTAVADSVQRWREQPLQPEEAAALADAVSEVASNAEAINLAPIEELAQALQVLLRDGAEQGARPQPAYFDLVHRATDKLIDQLDQLAAHQQPAADEALLAALRDYEAAPDDDGVSDAAAAFPAAEEQAIDIELPAEPEEAAASTEAVDDGYDIEIDEAAELPVADTDSEEDSAHSAGAQADEVDSDIEIVAEQIDDGATDDADSLETAPDETSEAEPHAAVTEQEPAEASAGNDSQAAESAAPAEEEAEDEVDEEIREIFLEEADDLLEAIDEVIHKWGSDTDNPAYLADMQRLLHTLKGGARLAGLKNLGNLSHNFETFLINAEQQQLSIDAAFLAQVQSYQDQLMQRVQAVKAGESTPPVAEEAAPEMPPEPQGEAPAPAADRSRDNVVPFQRDGEQRQEVVPFIARGTDGGESQPQPAPRAAPEMVQQNRRGPQEVVKVSAQLLEELVNLAGETSIARGRSEEQVSELVFALDEMQITVERLQEQVRRLDGETEAQILFRQEQVESEGLEGFDPLEFDRYSLLQQLSRSLMESASDLTDIRGTLADKARDMETLLLQQSRINTDLQEGLMRSRMVPFSRMVPRLRRIVRQVSGELRKNVEFEVLNAEGELDRSVLERIVAPLEHMLRNAVDHGIESADDRAAAGKPKTGRIQLSLGREGGEVLLVLRDDGRGIDLEAVKRKAIERGLMDADAHLSDREILQFILSSGFSTAQQVTQISGRGVGMDVVHSEIKQLGGSVEIQSEWGHGTTFLVRLPFTVSVNRALMVSVGGDVYAVPLNTIEGIVRVSPFELEAYYQPDAPLFEYAGQPYLLRYMGSLLRAGDKPNLDGQTMPLPVILVRGADHSVAVQVDSLLGSREIVVKTLGPQFGMVQGLSGATVLGDGSVVVILDLMAMIRADASHLHRDLELDHDERETPEERPLLVMVVDDSVTVRKVTSRFLERQGMEVWLAKDGVDAITQLQEQERVPDVMLLDIEMPRMDGFEVASRIRHTSRWEHVPIIMITSRTGEKHRERALSLGVNKYLGKPYQEMELLDNIYDLTGAEPDRR